MPGFFWIWNNVSLKYAMFISFYESVVLSLFRQDILPCNWVGMPTLLSLFVCILSSVIAEVEPTPCTLQGANMDNFVGNPDMI